MRGGIAFALSLGIVGSTPGGLAIYTSTLAIIFFTVLVEGGITIPLLEKLEVYGSTILQQYEAEIILPLRYIVQLIPYSSVNSNILSFGIDPYWSGACRSC